MSNSPPPPPPSARAKKRQRHKQNQRARAESTPISGLQAFSESPTLSATHRAWLTYLQNNGSAQERRSASNFSRVFQIEIARSFNEPDICEKQLLNVDFFMAAVHAFAGSFILEKSIENPSKISRIGSNLCSFIWFLGKLNVFNVEETQNLHDYCAETGANLIRSARAERTGEPYAAYVREAYQEADITENEGEAILFKGGFEIAYVGKRFCLLTDWKDSGLNHALFRRFDPLKARFPSPMTRQLWAGDHIHLEIRKIRGDDLWVPTECYGVYPEGADSDENESDDPSFDPAHETETPRPGIVSLPLAITEELSTMQIHEPTVQVINQPLKPSSTYVSRGAASRLEWQARLNRLKLEDLPPDGFDEAKYTDRYFAHLEIDIGDDDMGFGINENIPSDSEDD